MDGRLYLVVEPMALIAEDLASCIHEKDSAAHVVCVASLAGAGEEVARRQRRFHAAFLQADPQDFAATPLAAQLSAHGAHLVFIGDAAEASGQGWQVLERPFSAETVGEVLACLMEKAPGAAPGA
jgi:electron transfer flavoprotein alpha/beta subunit